MVADRATGGRTEDAMVSGDMARDTADSGALDAALGLTAGEVTATSAAKTEATAIWAFMTTPSSFFDERSVDGPCLPVRQPMGQARVGSCGSSGLVNKLGRGSVRPLGEPASSAGACVSLWRRLQVERHQGAHGNST